VVKVQLFIAQEVGQHPETEIGGADTTTYTAQFVKGIVRTTAQHQLCGLPANFRRAQRQFMFVCLGYRRYFDIFVLNYLLIKIKSVTHLT
jgi:hypothetical protein